MDQRVVTSVSEKEKETQYHRRNMVISLGYLVMIQGRQFTYVQCNIGLFSRNNFAVKRSRCSVF